MTSIPFHQHQHPWVTPDKVLLVIAVAFIPFWILRGKNFLRSFQLARKLPGPSLWEIVSVHREALMGNGIVTRFFELTSRYDFKPWSLWTPIHHITVISDPETIGEAFRSKMLINKDDRFYNGIAEHTGPSSVVLNGPEWKVRRNIVNPVFNKSSIEHNLDVINEEADRLTQEVSGKADGTDLDIYYIITKALVRSSVRSLGVRERDLDEKFIYRICWALDFVTSMAHKKFINPLKYYLLANFQTPTKDLHNKYIGVKHEMFEMIREVAKSVERRVNVDLDPDTPLQVLVVASVQKNILTEYEMISELLTLLAASVETTSTVITAVICMLAIHPEVQIRARNEIESIFGDTNRPASPEDLRRLEYLECVIKESMRLFPPGAMLPRIVDEETVLNETIVAKGSSVMCNFFALHRNPKIFKDPLKFDPDRFSPGAQEGRHPYAYLPFSSGARNCVGRLHAMITMKTMLSSMLRKHEILPCSGIKNVCDLEVKLNFTLHICNPYVRVVPVNAL